MKLRPSERHRWSRCTGYPAFKDILESDGGLEPETPSPYAWAGTAKHELLHEALAVVEDMDQSERDSWYEDSSASLMWLSEESGRLFADPGSGLECVVDHDFIEDVSFCLLAVAEMARRLGKGTELYSELSVGEAFGGTIDVLLVNERTLSFAVLDAKFGTGQAVAVENNRQLQSYAVLAKASEASEPMVMFWTAIIQPKKGGLKDKRHDICELHAWERELQKDLLACVEPTRRLAVGSWCRWCPCATMCPAIGNVYEDAVRYADTPATVEALAPEKLGEMLQVYEDVLEPFMASVKKQLMQGLETGSMGDATGWKLVSKRSSRQWIDDGKVLDWFTGRGISPESVTRRSVLSPAQVEKEIKRNGWHIKASDMEPLYRVVSGENTIARLADKRPKKPALAALGAFPGMK